MISDVDPLTACCAKERTEIEAVGLTVNLHSSSVAVSYGSEGIRS